MAFLNKHNSRVVKHDESTSSNALEVVLGQEQHSCLHTLDITNVISQMHLEGGVSAHCRPKEGTGMAL